MTEPVTVLMPVGPNYNENWLLEAFNSAVNQTYSPREIFLFDDRAGLFRFGTPHYPFMPGTHILQQQPTSHMLTGKYYWYNKEKDIFYSVWFSPTNVGFRAAFNLGMALADNELVVYLAADDKLMPTTIEKAVATWEANNRKDAWYPMPYIDSNGNVGSIANNLAMTTKHFFLDMCGGYPPAAFVGPDAALLSCLMVHAPDRIIPVKSDEPLYWIREHPDTETHTHTAKYAAEMTSIRGKLTEEFKLNE